MKVRLPVRNAILKRRTYEAPAEGRWGKIRLDFNENTAGCSNRVIRALAGMSPKLLAMYPEYKTPTARLARYFGVPSKELLITNGGDDALRVIFDTFVDPGSRVLICEPTFPMYRYYAEISGAKIDVVRYGPDMAFPLAPVLKQLKLRPRVLFMANPNNPTGTLIGKNEILQILRAARNTVVVLDEAYSEFSGFSAIALIRKFPQLFVARTFSKVTGLASLRLGAVIACKESLAFARRAMPPFPVNLAALVAAEAALRDRAGMREYVHRVKELREWLASELHAIGIRVFPSAGNFLLANFGAEGIALFRQLARKGILLRDRSSDMGPGLVRITIGTRSEIRLLVQMIKKKWRSRPNR